MNSTIRCTKTVFNLTSRTLYVKYYNSNRIAELQLTEELLNSDDLVIFDPITQGLSTDKVNYYKTNKRD